MQPTTVDITSVGGATFDVFVSAPHTTVANASGKHLIQFPLGAKVKVESVTQSCGGGAANTSVGFSRLGLRARLCTVIASDQWGEAIVRALMREGVLLDAAIVVEGEVSSFSIIFRDSATGERTILYVPSVSQHLREPLFPKDLIGQSRWLFLNHLADVSSSILDACCTLVKKPSGLRFAWNPGGSQLRDGYRAPVVSALLRETNILFLNREEAFLFLHVDSMQEACRLAAKAGVRFLCMTDGAKGAVLSDGKSMYCCGAANVPVVDTTGAGDAFASGVTWAIARELDLRTALKAGILDAASVIGAVGAQAGLLTETEIRAQLHTTTLDVTSSPL